MTQQQSENMRKYFTFLDALRATGATNMYGAGPYLRAAFPELTKQKSWEVLNAWMESKEENGE